MPAPIAFPIKFTNPPTGIPSADLVSVPYDWRPYSPENGRKSQPVLAGRNILSPSIKLDDYNCTAVVDWLEVSLETPGVHQAVNIHRFLSEKLKELGSKCTFYVTGPQRKRGYTGSFFILWIQQPTPQYVLLLMQSAVKHYKAKNANVGSLPVLGIEVSVDFKVRTVRGWSPSVRNLKRWQIQDLLVKHLRVDPDFTELKGYSPRFTKVGSKPTIAEFVVRRTAPKRGSTLATAGIDNKITAALILSAYHLPLLDMTYYVGSSDESVYLRIMDKTSDRRDLDKSIAFKLHEREWRARIEVCLLGEKDLVGAPGALGLHSLRDLFGFKFREIRKPMFEFYLPTFDGDGTDTFLELGTKVSELEVFRRGGVYGLDRLHRSLYAVATQTDLLDDNCHHAQKLGKKGRLVSYLDLNRKVDRALKALEARWEIKKRPARIRTH